MADNVFRGKYFTYEKPTDTKTDNDQMSEKIKDTLESWKEAGYQKWTESLDKLPIRIYVRYVTVKDKKPMVRLGGVVIKNNVAERYVVLFNTVIKRGFSVQYDALKSDKHDYVGAYFNPQQIKDKERRAEEKKQNKDKTPTLVKDKEPVKKGLSDEEVEDILKKIYYEDGNFVGRDKLHGIVQDRGHKISRKRVDEWLKNQTLYQLTKPSKKSKGVKPVISKAPYNIVEMDLATYDKEIMFNVIDVHTRFVWTEIIKNKTPQAVLKALKKIIERMDKKPRLILSDNGTEFKNKHMTKFLEDQEIKQLFGIAGSPQGQGIIERFNGTIKNLIKKATMEGGETLSPELLQKLVKNYNEMKHDTIGFKPSESFDEDKTQKIISNTEKASRANLQMIDNDLRKGDKVRLAIEPESKIGKKDINWTEEIFTVSRVYQATNKAPHYKVKDSEGKKIKGYLARDQLQLINKAEGRPTVKYVIEKILDIKMINQREYMLVKWKGYKTAEATYEPVQDLREDIGAETLKELVEDYEKNKRRKDRKKYGNIVF